MRRYKLKYLHIKRAVILVRKIKTIEYLDTFIKFITLYVTIVFEHPFIIVIKELSIV